MGSLPEIRSLPILSLPFSVCGLTAAPRQANAEVPIYISFTTGQHAAYGQAVEDDSANNMMLSLQLKVFCRLSCIHTYTLYGITYIYIYIYI